MKCGKCGKNEHKKSNKCAWCGKEFFWCGACKYSLDMAMHTHTEIHRNQPLKSRLDNFHDIEEPNTDEFFYPSLFDQVH